MEKDSNITNIVSIYNIARRQLDEIEKKINGKDYYNKYLKEIAGDYNNLPMIETLYLDSFVLLNFKKSIDIISDSERKILTDLFKAFRTDKASLSITFYTNESLRNNIISNASSFRKNSLLSKARMYYSLDDVSIGILSNVKFEIKSEFKSYDFDISHIKKYIISNQDNKDLVTQLSNYFKTLFLYDINKYNSFTNYMRLKTNNVDNINSHKLISNSEILDFIKDVTSDKKQAKIFEIIKK